MLADAPGASKHRKLGRPSRTNGRSAAPEKQATRFGTLVPKQAGGCGRTLGDRAYPLGPGGRGARVRDRSRIKDYPPAADSPPSFPDPNS
jgi:hypothetical protein